MSAACEDDVLSIGKKLDKITNGSKPSDGALELLDALANLPINIDILMKTQIGMKLNNFRKAVSDEKVAKRAKQLIREWKSMLDTKDEKNGSKPSSSKPSANGTIKEPVKAASPATVTSSDSRESASDAAVAALVQRTYSGGFPPSHLANDSVRSKSAEMILNALRYADLPNGTLDPEELAVKIEEKLFTAHKGTGDKYKAALRSRVFNLRDKKNPALRENVLTGVVKAETFAVMTSEEMASDEIRQMRDKFNKEAILEHQMSVQQGTPSEMFKCGKCGKKNCTYTQLQTRSSDEPMTTFVFCLECGNRWKFC
ncbi:hypothetical protein WR25_15379 [Diploscapter pachys]|uniref:Transcription elongation factor n=1 Tax=Diploscapter pachys TaxID=2018661 RepID=A0A2A2LJL7_9BILA|nr:hypothetical protein WR25_15379 [Diploscapter pachys]